MLFKTFGYSRIGCLSSEQCSWSSKYLYRLMKAFVNLPKMLENLRVFFWTIWKSSEVLKHLRVIFGYLQKTLWELRPFSKNFG